MYKNSKLYHQYASSINDDSLAENICKDLNIDELFDQLDYTSSCVGRQYLYHILCSDSISNVSKHEQFIKTLKDNNSLRKQLVNTLQKLNKPDTYTIIDILFQKEHHYSRAFLTLLEICRWLPTLFLGLIFAIPSSPIPFLLLLITYIINGYLHFKQKKILSCYFFSIPQLHKLLIAAEYLSNIPALTTIDIEINNCISHLKKLRRKLGSFRFGISLESEVAMLVYLISELINIFTLYATVNIVSSFMVIQKQKKEIEQVFRFIGFLDTLCSISFLRENIPFYCHPSCIKDNNMLHTEHIYHPLIAKCVSNDITLTNKSMLITGSNMSGKTSFIRTIAINLLTGKTLNTCFAKVFSIDINRKLYSVIHTEDNLLEGKSYFFKEVENVKEALAKGEQGNYLLIFDELFKGTNTLERIAINSAVFSSLADKNNLILTSTHDIELTETLNDKYELYHFSETITDNTLTFDYRLKKGVVKEGNAIRILKLCNYPPKIIIQAEQEAKQMINKRLTS